MKRIIAILMAVIIFLPVTQIRAEDSNYISFYKVKTQLLENNRTLKQLENQERQAYLRYDEVYQAGRSVNTEGKSYELFGEERFFKYDINIQMLLTKKKLLVPEQMKYAWEKTENSKITTEKNLIASSRGLYLALLSSDEDYSIKQEKLRIADKKYNQDAVKLEQGLITRVVLEQSAYNLEKARKELDAAVRNRENASRSLNAFIGAPINISYSSVRAEDVNSNLEMEAADYYIEKALKERNEITDIQRQLEVKKLQQGIIEKNQVHKIYTAVADEHEKLIEDIEMLELKLENERYKIEEEIKTAYIDVKKERGGIESTKLVLETQKLTLNKVREQYNQGLITQTVLEELQVGIDEIENGLGLSVFSYNTKRMKFENATGIGPAY